MTSHDYIRTVKELLLPKEEQTHQFAEFVSEAHSWYKHLPLYPGKPFFFYLDPNAGRRFVHTQAGDVAFVDITEDSSRFHYTWQTTESYRKRFGFWNYYAPYGSSFLFAGEGGVVNTAGARRKILAPKSGWLEVPETLMETGKVLLNSLVHPQAQLNLFWIENSNQEEISYFCEDHDAFIQQLYQVMEKEDSLLPASVTSNILRLYAFWQEEDYQKQSDQIWDQDGDIIQLSEAWEKTTVYQKEREILDILESLIEKERERQLELMKQAMNRFLEALYQAK